MKKHLNEESHKEKSHNEETHKKKTKNEINFDFVSFATKKHSKITEEHLIFQIQQQMRIRTGCWKISTRRSHVSAVRS